MKTIVLCVFLCMNLALAQSNQISGVVSDSATHEALPYATIRLSGTPRGTISNSNGEFLMDVDSFPATVIVSYIGYGTDSMIVGSPEQARNLQINLERQEITMPEVVVNLSDTYAADLVKKVYKKIRSDNNVVTDGKAFYRAYASVNSNYTEIFEMFLDALLDDRGITDATVEQGRYAKAKFEGKYKLYVTVTNLLFFSTNTFKLSQTGDSFFSFLPFVKKAIAYVPIREDAEKYFYLRTNGFYQSSDGGVAIIQFSPKPDLDRPAVSGTMEIDTTTDDVLRIKEEVNDSRFKPFDFHYMGYYLSDFTLSYNARFVRDASGNNRLSFLGTQLSFDGKNDSNLTFVEHFSYSTLLTFYEYGNKSEFRPKTERDEKNDLVSIMNAKYDPEFWKRHQGIINEIPIEQSVKESFIKHGFYGNLFPGGEPLNEK